MKQIVFRGPCLTQSGYGTHARQVARWLLGLEKQGKINVTFQPTNWGVTPWHLDRDRCNGLVGEIMDRSTSNQGPFDVSFQVQLPNEWDSNLARYNVGVTAAIETDRCNPSWYASIANMDKVVVPSEHARKSVLNQITKDKLVVIPESFIDEILEDDNDGKQFDFSTSFNYLLFGQLTGNHPENDRKNIFNTIKWFCEEFKSNKEVGLVLKTNSGKSTKIDRMITSNIVKKVISEVRQGEYPKVHFLHGDLSEKDVANLYKNETVKCLLTLTRGEGFGLPILEAAASDLPIIATNWSAHTEFLNQGSYNKVRYNLINVPKSKIDGQIFIDGCKWADVEEKDAKKRMRIVFNDSSTTKISARIMGKKIRNNYSFKEIEKHYNNQFGEII